MPPILIWTKHFGYFRDQAGSPLTFIILMDSDRTKDPTLTKFICSTHDEVARWQKIFSEGFDNFGKPEESEMESMQMKEGGGGGGGVEKIQGEATKHPRADLLANLEL
ncbi:unnamed protein product [Rodentolepis nana]|uniref:PH domain-containing protein n=1 Tax=Rodentolepis nana TaxID=102285 RepID=A0A0R3T2D1_RODNA|nr:unnamed protein product [Rodentolepis nana]